MFRAAIDGGGDQVGDGALAAAASTRWGTNAATAFIEPGDVQVDLAPPTGRPPGPPPGAGSITPALLKSRSAGPRSDLIRSAAACRPGVGDVGRQGARRLAAVLADAGGQVVQAVSSAGQQGHPGAAGGQVLSRRLADAAGGSVITAILPFIEDIDRLAFVEEGFVLPAHQAGRAAGGAQVARPRLVPAGPPWRLGHQAGAVTLGDGSPPAENRRLRATACARLRPDTAGLTGDGRIRRVPGLRRDEVARLAGVSASTTPALEQGRGGHPSPEVVAALGRALRPDPSEAGAPHRPAADPHLLTPPGHHRAAAGQAGLHA